MPVGIRKRRPGEGGKAYKIVKLVGGRPTGSVEGESGTRTAAAASARIRNQATEG